MSRPDVVEFYLNSNKDPLLLCRIESSFRPQESEYVCIRKVNYMVETVSFTVDHADKFNEKQVCCNVYLKRV